MSPTVVQYVLRKTVEGTEDIRMLMSIKGESHTPRHSTFHLEWADGEQKDRKSRQPHPLPLLKCVNQEPR